MVREYATTLPAHPLGVGLNHNVLLVAVDMLVNYKFTVLIPLALIPLAHPVRSIHFVDVRPRAL